MSAKRYYYSDKIFQDINTDRHPYRCYISIPVIQFNVILTYSSTPALNHFERAILSLCLNGYHTPKELSDLLLINLDLVKFILDNLKNRNLLDLNKGTTKEGEDLLSGIYKETTTKACCIFLDKNSNSLLRYCPSNEEINKTYSNSGVIRLSSEYSYLPSVKVKDLDFSRNVSTRDISELKKRVSRDFVNFISEESNLINFDIVGDCEFGNLVTFVEPGIYRKSIERWVVCDPFDIEKNDSDIRDYLYENADKKEIADTIQNVLLEERNKNIFNPSKKNLNFIKNELFNVKVDDEDEAFIEPLSNILMQFTESEAYDKNTQMSEYLRKFSLNIIDLFENIFYLSAKKDNFEFSDKLRISKEVSLNSVLINNIARNIGFNTDENTQKMFSIDWRALKDCKNKPKGKLLNACISYVLLISYGKKNTYLSEIADKYPNFISELYELKRKIRDTTRHTFNIRDIDTELYTELALYVLDLALGYSASDKKIQEYKKTTVNKNYSFAHEKIRSVFGNNLFDSTNSTAIDFRTNLISCFDQYINNDAAYLSTLRSITEQVFKNILETGVKKHSIILDEDFVLNEMFVDSEQIISFFRNFGFYMNPILKEQENFEQPFTIKYDSETTIKYALANGFNTTNFSYKLLCFGIMINISDSFKEIFDFESYPELRNLLNVCVAIMFADKGHNQNNVFDQDTANILIEKTFALLQCIYNSGKFLNWR